MSNEAKTKISIEYNLEKVSATRMYMSGKGLNLERELTKYLEILYDKNVPNQVREFIKMKEDSTEVKDKKPVRNAVPGAATSTGESF